MQIPETKRRRITKAQIRKWIAQQQAEIPELEANANYHGSCWLHELGWARGYIYAMKEILGERD